MTRNRLWAVTALSVLFLVGALISFTASVSLLSANSFLLPIWRLNPRAQVAFMSIGGWAIVLLLAVCAACLAAAIGLWRGARWGHRVAVTMIAINLIGDIANTVLGTEPRAIIGVPIAAAILWYILSKRVRGFFRHEARCISRSDTAS
jgi:uncharacterized membrane protein (DUF2068 family)